MKNKRVGIFGGSFNPIHYGHLRLSECILKSGLVDEVWLMVSPQNPLKESRDLLGENSRYEMARIATKNNSRIVASNFEFGLPRPSYTWRTMKALEEKYPDFAFKIIIGADNWQLMPKWAHHEELLRNYGFIVYPRKGFGIEDIGREDNVTVVKAPLFPFSSTEIRSRIKKRESTEEMIPPEVAEIIRKNSFYKKSDDHVV